MSVSLDREFSSRGLVHFVKRAWKHVGLPTEYTHNWHVDVVCSVLERAGRGEIDRFVINVPPGTLKSLLTGVFWPAWEWTTRPWLRWMFASFDERLMARDARYLLTLVRSRWYVERWGEMIDSGGAVAIMDLQTKGGGGRFGTSMNSKGTGRHVHIQLFDDPVKPASVAGEAAYTGTALDTTWDRIANTFATRTCDPRFFVRGIVMQRLCEGDPADRAIGRGWYSLRLPMRCELDGKDPLDPRTEEGELLFQERIPESAVAKLEEDLGEHAAAQLQQNPDLPGGSILQEDWITLNACDPEQVPLLGVTIHSWDLAFKGKLTSDPVAGAAWRSAWMDPTGEETERLHFYGPIGEPFAQRATFTETCEAIRSRWQEWPDPLAIVLEDKANAAACEDTLKNEEFGHLLELRDPGAKSKEARVHSIAYLWKQGRVHLVRGPHFDRQVRTFRRFPRVKHDDEVDVMSQALLYLSANEAAEQTMRAAREDLARLSWYTGRR